MAKSAATPVVKRAIQRIFRDDSGALGYTLIDLQTMQPVTDPTGYKIINQYDSHVEEVTDVSEPDAPKSEAAQIRQETVDAVKEQEAARESRGDESDRGNYTTSGTGDRSSATLSGSGGKSTAGGGTSFAKSFTDSASRPLAMDNEAKAPQGVTDYGPTGLLSDENANRKGPSLTPAIANEKVGFATPKDPTKTRESKSQGINYNKAGDWTKGMGQETIDVANRLGGAMGSMDMTSATRSHAHNKAVGGAANSSHLPEHGGAFDVSTRGMTDDEKQHAVEMGRLSGASRIGTYKDGSLHFDTRSGFAGVQQPGGIKTVDGTYGMYDYTGVNAASRAPGWFTKGMTQDTFAPTPFGPDEKNPNTKMRASTEDTSVAQEKIDSVAAGLNKDPTKTQFTREEMENFTPAQASYYGYTKPTPEEVQRTAMVAAGEISQATLDKALAGNPEALQHVGNFVSIVDNRGSSLMHKNRVEALNAPSQFSALNAGMIGTTTERYAKYGPQVTGLIESYYAGNPAMKPTQFDLTHYYNPAEATPKWSGVLQDATDLLDHRFGKLNKEYAPNNDWQKSWKDTVAKQFDYSGSSFANKPGVSPNLDTPIEKSGARGGLANMPGGSNYASSRTGSLSDENANKSGGMGGRSSSVGSSPSAHSVERGRDTSLGGSDRSGSVGGRSSGSSSSSNSSTAGTSSRGSSASNARSDTPSSGRSGGFGGNSNTGGGVKTDKSSSAGGPVDKAEKGW